jgi:hypothetical protein
MAGQLAGWPIGWLADWLAESLEESLQVGIHPVQTETIFLCNSVPFKAL